MFDNLMIDNSFYTALIVFFAQLKRQGREKDLCTLKRFDFLNNFRICAFLMRIDVTLERYGRSCDVHWQHVA